MATYEPPPPAKRAKHSSNGVETVAPIPAMDGLPSGGVAAALAEMSEMVGPGEAPPKLLRFGIIGMGAMGLEHLRFIQLLEREGVATVAAIADPEPQQLAEASALVPSASAYAVVADMLNSSSVDAVIVATPNHTHLEVLRAAVKSEPPKHILMEKPLCTSDEDCVIMRQLVATMPTGVVFWVGMEYRYMPPIADLIARVDNGLVGDVKMMHVREHRFPFLTKVGNWNRFAENTGGTLVEKCCHFFDLMRRISGAEPIRVFASGGQDVNFLTPGSDGRKPDILDNAYVVLDFDDGSRSCMDFCMFAEDQQKEEVVVIGSHGKVQASAPELQVTFTRCTADGTSKIPPTSYHVDVVRHHPDDSLLAAGWHEGATYFQLHAFCRACRQGKNGSAAVSIEDGIRAVQIGAAAERSVREHRMVEIPVLPSVRE
eukprot:gnl/TRDRNA2_/TRDRNA2_125858_c0_seq1.p1 gnl/TRDRNA2_/TRDRNA2_125858_c0~~gnl/TRDRNA2_/TRDRNA2_125858_c0_seq1.p1  ORF type:complete len:429 (-),score=71.09 gnl/TRDRNA2_/TRDRNA2_125858_c0_seq1:179-1465(-)